MQIAPHPAVPQPWPNKVLPFSHTGLHLAPAPATNSESSTLSPAPQEAATQGSARLPAFPPSCILGICFRMSGNLGSPQHRGESKPVGSRKEGPEVYILTCLHSSHASVSCSTCRGMGGQAEPQPHPHPLWGQQALGIQAKESQPRLQAVGQRESQMVRDTVSCPSWWPP